MVKHLSWYMSKGVGNKKTYKTNVRLEVEKFKQKNPDATPIVMFDFLGTIPVLFTNYKDVMCGGRHALGIKRAEIMFQKFKDLGIEMHFFLDGPIKPKKFPEWCRRKNSEYENQKVLFENLKAKEPLNYRFHRYSKTYYENYLRVAKKYGRIFLSLENECDLDLAENASRVHPMAIFACDSDFLVMKGDFPIWKADNFNLETMTVQVWNKRRMRESLGLEQWQMPIFATLCGNDWVEAKLVEHIQASLPQGIRDDKSGKMQKALADLVRNTFKDKTKVNVKLSELIYNKGRCQTSWDEVFAAVKTSLDFYNCRTYKETQIEPSWLREHVMKTASFSVLNIYKKDILYISQCFIDLSKNDVCSFSDLVLPLLRRKIGLVFNNNRDAHKDAKHPICLKPNVDEPFAIHYFGPIFPDFEVPPLDDILAADEDFVTLEEKLRLFSWIVAPKRNKVKVELLEKLLKTIFIVPAVITNYLVKERQITPDEADVLLLTIFEASKMDMEKLERMSPPAELDERAFWLSFTYTYFVRYFEEAMTVCGLYEFIPYSYYDGYLFHKMYGKFLSMSYDAKKEILKSVQEYRLYVL
ncbi:unnamed protein product [Hermetia illucens]|uniref:Constitutive coactivator of peroxisome proliferator-activated receptor gamma n=1 Tax=Hermetia illucens TaxID=343691 RepID=A0A7R8UTK8_HERIL|nr:uncharacterized protein LOC119654409 [Hermetia illucens]XP_037915725.1 uncharacterized protein LOC119654409 [Hermetia illucens]CAD7086771.1 unnamed protein product [Hermetia illucens]